MKVMFSVKYFVTDHEIFINAAFHLQPTLGEELAKKFATKENHETRNGNLP